MSQMASDLEAVLDDAGIEQAHVVGASMGGTIAQQYARSTPGQVADAQWTSPGGPEAVPVPRRLSSGCRRP